MVDNFYTHNSLLVGRKKIIVPALLQLFYVSLNLSLLMLQALNTYNEFW